MLAHLLVKKLLLSFPQAYAFGLQLTKSVGYGTFFEYLMWVCGNCSRELRGTSSANMLKLSMDLSLLVSLHFFNNFS